MRKNIKPIACLILLLAALVFCSACTAAPDNNGTITGTATGTTDTGTATATDITARTNNSAGYNLYFGNKDYTSLIAERRNFSNTAWTAKDNIVDMATEAVNSLIAGPKNSTSYYAVMPKTAAVNYVKQEADGVLHVDMSNGYIDGYKDLGTPQSMSVYSIVNTLTGFEGVKKVRLTVDGNPLTIDNKSWGDPLARDDGLISAK